MPASMIAHIHALLHWALWWRVVFACIGRALQRARHSYSVLLHPEANVLTAESALLRIHRKRFNSAEKGVTAEPPWGPVEVLLLANDRVAERVTLGRLLHTQDMYFAVQQHDVVQSVCTV